VRPPRPCRTGEIDQISTRAPEQESPYVSLTGTPFFVLLLVLTVLSMVRTLLLWDWLGRWPRLPRSAARLALILLCQVNAICLVAVWINNSYGLYASWSDLLGQDNGTATAAMPGPPASQAKFTRGTGGVLDTYFRGSHSKLSGQVLVWTPPQYDEARYRTYKFPVVMLLHGVPGSPDSWLEGGGMPGAVKTLIEQGTVKPFILVMPVINPGGIDTTCSDTPDRKVATWLTDDVPSLIESQFRAMPDAQAWGLMGVSTGGFCAAKLPLQFPKTFSYGVAIDPDPFTGDKSALPDPKLRQLNSPLYLAKTTRAPIALYLLTTAQDRLSSPSDLYALQNVVQYPGTVQVTVLATGGHNWGAWEQMYPRVFTWLSTHLESAHAPLPPNKKPTPTKGLTHPTTKR
jgi:enterochelin esterase-like enzyme